MISQHPNYILAIDQGTSSTKALVFDEQGKAIARGSEALLTNYFGEGFVEQDPEAIYQNVLAAVKNCLADLTAKGLHPQHIAAIGISNQRETFLVWDANGQALHPAIVWQCKRSAAICAELTHAGHAPVIEQKTGLKVDPYFSATKLIWLQRNKPAVAAAIQNGKAFFGTIDTWLLFRLSKGTSYATDYTNASRTLFFNLHTLQWDEELIHLFGLKGIQLPTIKPSSDSFGSTDIDGLLPQAIPITAMIGDSQAAAFGEGCFEPGTAKATMGTGSSILMNIGSTPRLSENGMVTTVCWSMHNRIDYAYEGVIVSCGATIEWLKNSLGLFSDSKETAAMAMSVEDNGGVYLVPAFSGLGSPHWQMDRKASITGMSFSTTKNHIVRAALESIAYQIRDVVNAMEKDAGIALQELNTDGGITANTFVMQFLADLLQKKVATIGMADVSALGAALLAGLKIGVYADLEALKKMIRREQYFVPERKVEKEYEGWKYAVGG